MNNSLLSDPKPTVKGYNNRILIKVDTHSIFFRNLGVYLYFFRDPKTGVVRNPGVDLVEMGIGAPGLITDSVTPILGMLGDWLVYDLAFTMEARIGSMEKEGLSVPFPVPSHQCHIHGTYNTRTGDGGEGGRFTHYE